MKFSERALLMQPSAIRRMTRLAATAGADLITFAGGMPNPATFPLEKLAEIASHEIRDHRGKSLQYGLTAGFRPLLDWLRSYLRNSGLQPPGLFCTTGSQQALDLITEIFVNPGDSIFVEVPTYIGALAVFRKSGARLIPVAQDQSGMIIEDLGEKLHAIPAERRKLIYTVSNFQNPSGISLLEERRKQLAAVLDEFDLYLIEDDPYGEIYFHTPPPAPVQHWNPQRVLLLGTFSKLVAPTFRTGWIVAEEPLLQKIELAKEAADLCGSMLDQRILTRFCSSPDFLQHLNALRFFYKQRHEAMESSLKQHMPQGVEWTKPEGGFFIWVKLPEFMDAESFLEEAIIKEKVSYIIGQPFTCDGSGKNFLRLAFSVEEPGRIQKGIKRLGELFQRQISLAAGHL